MKSYRTLTMLVPMTALMLSCASCKSGYGIFNQYTRDEVLAQSTVGTKKAGNKTVLEKKSRLVTRIRGSQKASFDVLSGPKNHLASHSAPPKIPGPPAVAPVNDQLPPLVAVDSNAVVNTVADDSDGEAAVLVSFPFFNLMSGYAYVSGIAPAAQTEHVVAGSDSTKFIIEIYKPTASPDDWIHRVYTVEGTVKTQARENGVGIGPIIPVTNGNYIEVRRDSGTWEIYGPATYPTGQGTFVTAVLAAAAAAGVP